MESKNQYKIMKPSERGLAVVKFPNRYLSDTVSVINNLFTDGYDVALDINEICVWIPNLAEIVNAKIYSRGQNKKLMLRVNPCCVTKTSDDDFRNLAKTLVSEFGFKTSDIYFSMDDILKKYRISGDSYESKSKFRQFR